MRHESRKEFKKNYRKIIDSIDDFLSSLASESPEIISTKSEEILNMIYSTLSTADETTKRSSQAEFLAKLAVLLLKVRYSKDGIWQKFFMGELLSLIANENKITISKQTGGKRNEYP